MMKEYNFNFYSTENIKSYNLNESIRYQLGMLDTLDAFTRRHSENVANLTCRICEKLHMKSYFTVYCTTCAYLHDIGKQFIPPQILQKNGPLTDEEYEVMKTHTTIGHKICISDLKLRPYANGALYHHEALDGTGYPNGVKDKDIPLEGKIIRVADEFDAIVSKRQYKSHIGICDTLKILLDKTSSGNKKILKKGSSENTNEPAKHQGVKIDTKVFKVLVKIVIEDTEYEISCLLDYINYINENITRLEQIKSYHQKLVSAKKESDISYYSEGIKLLFNIGETFENWSTVLEEYKLAHSTKQEQLNKLYDELKNIKKMK